MNRIKTLFSSKIKPLIDNGAFHIIVGSFCTKFVAFIGSYFLVRVLSKADYGILSYYENIVSYFAIFIGLGLSSGLLRFLILAKTNGEKKMCYERAIKRGTIYNLILLAACVLFCFLFKHPESFASYWFIGAGLAICAFMEFYVNSSLSSLRSSFKAKSYAVIAFITSALIIVARIAGALSFGLFGSVSFKIVIEILCAVFCVLFVYKTIFKGIKKEPLDKAFCREIDKYSLQVMFTDGLWAIFMLNDLFLLGQFIGDESILADYKVAYVIPANLSIMTYAIGVFIAPYFTKHEKEKDYNWVKKNCIKTTIITFFIMSVFTIVCFIFAEPFIVFLYTDKYISSVEIMRILLIASLFNNGIRQTIANILSAIGLQKANLIVAGIGIAIQVVLDIIFIPLWGSIGVAWSSVIVYFIMSMFLLVYIFIIFRRKKNENDNAM